MAEDTGPTPEDNPIATALKDARFHAGVQVSAAKRMLGEGGSIAIAEAQAHATLAVAYRLEQLTILIAQMQR